MTAARRSDPSRDGWERRALELRQTIMTTRDTSSLPIADLKVETFGSAFRGAISRLFASALDGDRRAEAALHLLGSFDDTAQHASWALLRADRSFAQPATCDLLASVDRVVATLRDRQPSLNARADAPRPRCRDGRDAIR